MKIYLGSDHAGVVLKGKIVEYLIDQKYDIEDLGTFDEQAVNWVQYGAEVAQKVSLDPLNACGILICGTGLGMSIVANKYRGVRAALCNEVNLAEMSRKHNNANILAMGARIIEADKARQIVDVWLNTEFEGGRHQKRLDYLTDPVEKNNFIPGE